MKVETQLSDKVINTTKTLNRDLMNATKNKILAGVATSALASFVSCLQAGPSLPACNDAPYSSTLVGAAPGRYATTPLGGKVYLGFDAGAVFQQDITITDDVGDSDQVTFGTGARLDCELGYNFTKNWAAELEVGLIISPVRHSVFLGTDFMDVDYSELPVMVNVIFTQPLGQGFSAYVGGGLGAVFSEYSDEFGDSTPSDTAFGFQGMAGIKYAINERWEIGVAYKFLGTTKHDVAPGFDSDGTMTHSVLLALTCKF